MQNINIIGRYKELSYEIDAQKIKKFTKLYGGFVASHSIRIYILPIFDNDHVIYKKKKESWNKDSQYRPYSNTFLTVCLAPK